MSSRVFIGRLSERASERDVEHFFRGYGRIREIVLKRGFGFIEFESTRDADDAIYDLNGKDLAGDRVTLELSRRGPRVDYDRGGRGGGSGNRFGPPTHTRHRLLVENLSTRVSWQDLKDMMRGAGEVTFADAHKERRNEGVICFASRSDLKRAIEKYDGKDVNGRRIKLVDDSDERSRSRSRSRGRSHSRSHSRSRSRDRRSRSRSHSRSRSNDRDSRSRSHSKDRKDKDRTSRSRSRSGSRQPSRSHSPMEDGKSRSASPTANGNGSPAHN